MQNVKKERPYFFSKWNSLFAKPTASSGGLTNLVFHPSILLQPVAAQAFHCSFQGTYLVLSMSYVHTVKGLKGSKGYIFDHLLKLEK